MNIENNNNSISEKKFEYDEKDIKSNNKGCVNKEKVSSQKDKIKIENKEKINEIHVYQHVVEFKDDDSMYFNEDSNNEELSTNSANVEDSNDGSNVEEQDNQPSNYRKQTYNVKNTMNKINVENTVKQIKAPDNKFEDNTYKNNDINISYSKDQLKGLEKSSNELQNNLDIAEVLYNEINESIIYSPNLLITKHPDLKTLQDEMLKPKEKQETTNFDENYDEIRRKNCEMRDLIENLYKEEYNNLEPSEQTTFNYTKIRAKYGEKSSIGNCREMADLAFVRLLDKGIYSAQVDIIEVIGGDHVFLVIGRDPNSDPQDYRTWGKNAVVCDPWKGKKSKDGCFPLSEAKSKLYYATGGFSKGETDVELFDPSSQNLKIYASNILTPRELEPTLDIFLQNNYDQMETHQYEEARKTCFNLFGKLQKFILSPSLLDKIKLANEMIDIINGNPALKDSTKILYQQLTYFQDVVFPKNNLDDNLQIARNLLKTHHSLELKVKDKKDSIFGKINQKIKEFAQDKNKLHPREKIRLKKEGIKTKLMKKRPLESKESMAFFEFLNNGFFNTHLDIVHTEKGNRTFIVIGRDVNSDPKDDTTWGENAVVCDLRGNQFFPLKQIQSGEVEVQKDGTLLHLKDNFTKPSNPPKNFQSILSNVSFPNELFVDTASLAIKEHEFMNDIKWQLKHFHGTACLYQKIAFANNIIEKIETNFKKLENQDSIKTLHQQLLYFTTVNASISKKKENVL